MLQVSLGGPILVLRYESAAINTTCLHCCLRVVGSQGVARNADHLRPLWFMLLLLSWRYLATTEAAPDDLFVPPVLCGLLLRCMLMLCFLLCFGLLLEVLFASVVEGPLYMLAALMSWCPWFRSRRRSFSGPKFDPRSKLLEVGA